MSLFDGKRVILVGGPGGVGKTTLAASLGVHLAEKGQKTVVLTVDPARRLAQALGLETFRESLERVPLSSSARGELYASMLDTQRYFDRIIERFARSPGQKEKILTNPIYRTMVDSLGGTHEYAAMERLFEFLKDDSFERIVVDTPPTQNAVDLLRAPQRLADFMDNSVLKWFQRSSPTYLRFFQRGTKLAMKVFEKLFGNDFLDSLGALMDDIEGMQQGFRNRHLELVELLKSDRTSFSLVTSPSASRFEETLRFKDSLRELGIPLALVVLNRVEKEPPKEAGETGGLKELLDYQHSLYRHQHRWVGEFEKRMAPVPLRCIPYQSAPPHDIAALSQLGTKLVS